MVSKRGGESERQRVPQPLIKKRIASGRGAMEQPNVTHDGEAALTPTFWVAVVLTGIATGLFGDLLMWILKVFERAGFNYRSGSYEAAVAATSDVHRVVVLLIAGVIGAISWFLIRRFLPHEKSEIDDAVWNGSGELAIRRSFLTSVISEVVIGLGASIGREAAPKLMGGASGSLLSRWIKLSPAQRKLLVACGGGAGLAAVYNVPLGGAIFTAEVLCGSFALPTVLPALACSLIATLVAWIYLPSGATYADIPSFRFSGSIMVWSLFAGLIIGLLAIGYVRLIGWVSHHRASGTSILWVMPSSFVLVGVVGIWYPQLFGNGLDMAHNAFLGIGGVGLLFVLFALKPLITALTLGSGAAGGVFTPFLSTGAVLGAFLGVVWTHFWPGEPVGAFALVGAAAMIGASMQAPLVGLVLVQELTHGGYALVIPMAAATLIATFVVRQVDGYSIYTARLPGARIAKPRTRGDDVHGDESDFRAKDGSSPESVTFSLVEGSPQTVLRRTFRASREDVYRAWTVPEILRLWWGPHAIEVTECAFDLVEGGLFRITMRAPDGVQYPMMGTLHNIDPPARFAMAVGLSEHPDEWIELFRPVGTPLEDVALEWYYEITFVEEADTTTVQVLATYPVVADRDLMLVMGAEIGWSESFVKLDALLASP